MARFYLNMSNGIGFVRDEEGQELPDLDAAREAAIAGIRSILSDEAKQGLLDLRGTVEITDESGQVLMVVPFKEAVELKLSEEGVAG